MGSKQGKHKMEENQQNQDSSNSRSNTDFNNKPYIVVPYVKGMSESCKNTCRKHSIEMHFKGGNTIKDLLVHPEDKDTILQKSGVIHRYKCARVDCEEEYIGNQAEVLQKGSENMRPPSPIHDHYNTTSHDLSQKF